MIPAETRLAGAIILSVIYGYDVAPKDDHYVKLVESTRPAFGLGLSPKWLVNSFPALRHIPSWLPGAGFKQYASFVNHKIIETQDATYNYAMTVSVRLGMLVYVMQTINHIFLVRLRRKVHISPLFAVYQTATTRRRT